MATNNIQRGQWVRKEILKKFPNIVKHRGADLDGNGKIEPRERLPAFSVADFSKYYLDNRKAIEKKIEFFRMAASLDPKNPRPDNPIHEFLYREYQFIRSSVVRDAYKFLHTAFMIVKSAKMLLDAAPSMPRKAKIEAIMRMTYSAMMMLGVNFGGHDLTLLTRGIAERTLDCNLSMFVAMGLSHQLGIKNVYAVTAPGHAFLRYEDKNVRFNLDYGRIFTDKFYIADFNISSTALKKGVFMKNLSWKETLSMYLSELAQKKFDLGDTRGSYKSIAKALRLNPRDINAFVMKAHALKKEGKANLAVKVLRRALAIAPQHHGVHNNLGTTYASMGRFHEAIHHYNKAIKYCPRVAWVYGVATAIYNRALAYRRAGRYNDQLSDLLHLWWIAPREAGVYYDISKTYEKLGKHQLAREFSRIGKIIKPTDEVWD